jgi:Rv2632c-like
VVGVGLTRLNPADRDVPEIGDELAVARALSDLGHKLLEAAAGDIEQITHQPAHLNR